MTSCENANLARPASLSGCVGAASCGGTVPRWWQADHPLWSCGMRPYFLLCLAGAPVLLLGWLGLLAGWWPVPGVPGGALVWHAHELVFGFGLAAVAGFVLTAWPEFTGSPAVTPRQLQQLVGLWALARLGFWCSGLPGYWGSAALALSGMAHLGLLLALALQMLPALRGRAHGADGAGASAGGIASTAPAAAAPTRRLHVGFLWALAGLAVATIGFHVDAWRGAFPLRWVQAAIGVLMMTIVVAMSRISMRMVNRALQERGEPLGYLARPPRRHLAVLCIALFTAAEWLAPGSRVAGWLAWAAAAAMAQLMADWHVGRALLRRWPLMLYAVYASMALGYAALGAQLLLPGATAAWLAPGAGRHLLTLGAAGLGIYMVVCIAGRGHVGLPLDERRWVPSGAALLLAAAVARALVWPAGLGLAGHGVAVLLWCAAWALPAVMLGPWLWRPYQRAVEHPTAACGTDQPPTTRRGSSTAGCT